MAIKSEKMNGGAAIPKYNAIKMGLKVFVIVLFASTVLLFLADKITMITHTARELDVVRHGDLLARRRWQNPLHADCWRYVRERAIEASILNSLPKCAIEANIQFSRPT